MPTPILPYLISGKVRNVFGNLLISGTVTLDHSTISPQLSTSISSQGEYTINLSGLSSQWNKGDSIKIKVTITGEGRIILTTTIKNSKGGQTENLTLEQTSDIDYEKGDLDRRNLVMTMPVLFDGEKVTVTKPLPVMNENPIEKYRATDDDTSGTTQYFGYTDRFGNWFIEQYNTTNGTHRYFKGSSDYPTNWSNRANLNYDYFYNIF